MAIEAADAVQRWCLDQGIANRDDLAFFFLSYEEALAEAGRAVADAFRQARREGESGLAGLIMDIASREGGDCDRTRAPDPMPAPLAKRAKTAGRAGPVRSAEVKHSAEASSLTFQVYHMLMAVGKYRPVGPAATPLERANLQRMADDICQQSEYATMKKGLDTFKD